MIRYDRSQIKQGYVREDNNGGYSLATRNSKPN